MSPEAVRQTINRNAALIWLACSVMVLFPREGHAQFPLVVEKTDVVLVNDTGRGTLPGIAVTVLNTGQQWVDAWGVQVYITFPDGTTSSAGALTDGYGRRLPGRTGGVAPGQRDTMNVAVGHPRVETPGASFRAEVYFLVLEDNTAFGQSAAIAGIFRQRSAALVAWTLAEQSLNRSRELNLPAEAALKRLLADMEAITQTETRMSQGYRDIVNTAKFTLNPRFNQNPALHFERLLAEAPLRRKLAEEHHVRR